jgi:hypothetical protein
MPAPQRRRRGHALHRLLRSDRPLRRGAHGLVGVFAKYGQLGQFLDWETWEIVVGGSTAGAMVPGGLALAGAWFGEPRYTEAAARLARHVVERDVRAGVTTAFEARVKLLAETSCEARERPLGQNALWGAPVVVVPAGQTVEWVV